MSSLSSYKNEGSFDWAFDGKNYTPGTLTRGGVNSGSTCGQEQSIQCIAEQMQMIFLTAIQYNMKQIVQKEPILFLYSITFAS